MWVISPARRGWARSVTRCGGRGGARRGRGRRRTPRCPRPGLTRAGRGRRSAAWARSAPWRPRPGRAAPPASCWRRSGSCWGRGRAARRGGRGGGSVPAGRRRGTCPACSGPRARSRGSRASGGRWAAWRTLAAGRGTWGRRRPRR